ncbi:MAG: MBOAT family protein [Lachnospiraceae bacterium]|nr:MBOAT family protein [Lachnospiraceae bacterium]
MVFSSLFFTFSFLPLVLLLYFIAKEPYRNYILLAASLLFYAYGEPAFVFVMIASIAVNYGLAVWIAGKKQENSKRFAGCLLAAAVVANIGILFIFKYLDFAITSLNLFFHTNYQIRGIALPIGISFFTFQALSYVIDVYRGTVKVQKNPLYLALYISFFPQLIAGPIVRYSDIEKQLIDRTCTPEGFAEGARRFMLGFCKKVILANNLAIPATAIFNMDAIMAPPILWLGSICYSLQIFYDFSGYSDMAIGLGKIFGFHFQENFRYPYISKSVTEFWRRWHISLGQWFRDYVYIPLGGSKVSVPKHIFNMFVVWSLTGIWHGARFTFIAWGIGYFVLLVIEKYIVKPEKRRNRLLKVFWQLITLLCINFGWVIFNSGGLKSGIRYCLAMLGTYGVPFTIDAKFVGYMREYGIFIAAGLLFATPVMEILKTKTEQSRLSGVLSVITPFVYGILFLWAVSFIILGTHNPFIYFNF